MKNNHNFSLNPQPHHPQINSYPRNRTATQINRNEVQFKPTFSTQQYSQQIKQLIGDAEKLSIQLLSIAEKANMSNAKIKFPKYNPGTKQVEQNLHKKFDEIEQKFRDLHRYVEQKMREMIKKGENSQGKYDSNYFEITKALQDNRYEFLNDKIKGLESSLQETKKNETRLLEIIQKLIQKYQISETATFLKQNYHPEIHQSLRQRSGTKVQSYQPILEEKQPQEQLDTNLNTQHENHDTQSIYHRLYPLQSGIYQPDAWQEKRTENIKTQYQEKEQTNGFRLRQMSQDIQPIYIRKLFSKGANYNSQNLSQSKRSLKSDIKSSGTTSNSLQKNMKIYRDAPNPNDKEHRMKFMIGNLKQ